MNQIVNELDVGSECLECEDSELENNSMIEIKVVIGDKKEKKQFKKKQKNLSKELLKIFNKSKYNNNYLRELKSADIERSKVFYRHSWNY